MSVLCLMNIEKCEHSPDTLQPADKTFSQARE